MSTPWSWSGGGGRQADKGGWSQKVTEMGWGTDKDEKGKKGGCTMTEGLKPSNSHVQPMERRPQTIQLPHTTHGTKTSNWHPIPMERRLQTIQLPCTTHGTSNLAK